MLKLWVGPLPVMVLFHPDSVEVSAFASCLTVTQSSIQPFSFCLFSVIFAKKDFDRFYLRLSFDPLLKKS